MSFFANEPDHSGKDARENRLENVENPYAITSKIDQTGELETSLDTTPVSIATTVLVWTVVCSLSAAPSFFFAINEVAKNQAIAMILGVVIFIGIYSIADLLSRNLPFRQNARMRTILRATFIVRSIMVVIFPVAIMTDLMLGMISVGLVQGASRPWLGENTERHMGFGMALITTLVQGCMLSIFLFFLGLLISAIVFVIRSLASAFAG